jgi:hypothetical protein
MRAIRDNVVFEFGLFVGALGLNRCFLVMPRDSEPLHMPTDLLGLAPLTYATNRADANIVAALGPAANRVRRAMRELFQARRPERSAAATASDAVESLRMTAEDFVEIWNSTELATARAVVRTIPSSPYGYDDEEMDAHRGLRRIFTFLEGLADAILSGDIDEAVARIAFERPVTLLWPHMYTLLAPANHAEDWWRRQPLPRLAELYRRWAGSERQFAE